MPPDSDTLDLTQAIASIDSIEDTRLRYIARYAFHVAISTLTMDRDGTLIFGHLKHLVDGGKPAESL